jgi:hypothetical protein
MAVQAGLGTHFPLTTNLDFSTNLQYMLHLGKEISHETRTAGNGDQFLYLDVDPNTELEGHLLLTFSLNLKVADFWKDAQGKRTGGPPKPEEEGY